MDYLGVPPILRHLHVIQSADDQAIGLPKFGVGHCRPSFKVDQVDHHPSISFLFLTIFNNLS